MPEWDFSVIVQECSHSKIPGTNFRSVFNTASLDRCPLMIDHMRRQQCFQCTEPCWAPGCCTACTRAGMSPDTSPALRHSGVLYPCWAPSSHCSISHSILQDLKPSLYFVIQVLQHACCKTAKLTSLRSLMFLWFY